MISGISALQSAQTKPIHFFSAPNHDRRIRALTYEPAEPSNAGMPWKVANDATPVEYDLSTLQPGQSITIHTMTSKAMNLAGLINRGKAGTWDGFSASLGEAMNYPTAQQSVTPLTITRAAE